MNQPLLKTSFGLVAKEYQKYRRSYDPKLYQLLFSLLAETKPNQKLTLLDIGCGTGKSTEPLYLQAKMPQPAVFGVDPDEAMLDQARISAKKQKLSITYLEGSAESLQFDKETFDGIISGAAFHWFANAQALKEIKRTLKQRGLFFIFWTQYVKTNKPAIGDTLYEKYKWRGIPQNLRSQTAIKTLLIKSGFKKVKTPVIPFIEKHAIQSAIGVLKTNSSYALMSPETKKSFVQEMTEAYKEALGKEKYITNKLELRICYGRK